MSNPTKRPLILSIVNGKIHQAQSEEIALLQIKASEAADVEIASNLDAAKKVKFGPQNVDGIAAAHIAYDGSADFLGGAAHVLSRTDGNGVAQSFVQADAMQAAQTVSVGDPLGTPDFLAKSGEFKGLKDGMGTYHAKASFDAGAGMFQADKFEAVDPTSALKIGSKQTADIELSASTYDTHVKGTLHVDEATTAKADITLLDGAAAKLVLGYQGTVTAGAAGAPQAVLSTSANSASIAVKDSSGASAFSASEAGAVQVGVGGAGVAKVDISASGASASIKLNDGSADMIVLSQDGAAHGPAGTMAGSYLWSVSAAGQAIFAEDLKAKAFSNTANSFSVTDAGVMTAASTSSIGSLSFTDSTTEPGLAQITGLAQAPSGDTAAASKYYVDQLAQGLKWKDPVMAASTANVALSGAGALVIDGYTVQDGDRLLLKDQDTASANGIYVATIQAGNYALNLAPDFDTATEKLNATTLVEWGDTNKWQSFTCNSVSPMGVTWVQISGPANISAGVGLDKSGNSIFVKPADESISATNSGIKVELSDASLTKDAGGKIKVQFVDQGLQLGVSGLDLRLDGYSLAESASGLKVQYVDEAIQLTNAGFDLRLASADELSKSASGLKVEGVPSQFKIGGTAVSANVSATNLDTLTGGATSVADSLHMHAAQVASFASVGEDVAAGAPIAISAITGAPVKAKADPSSGDLQYCLGLAAEGRSTGAALQIVTSGMVALDMSAYQAGQALYIGPSGDLTADPGTGMEWIRVGYVVDSSRFFVQVQNMGFLAA